MVKQDVIALKKRQQEVEEELVRIKQRIALANTDDSLKEGTTASTCDCAIPSPIPKGCPQVDGLVPYGSMDQKITESSPLMNKTMPDHIVIGEHELHDWEECFSHVRSEEDLENEKIHNESEFYLKSSMFARGKRLDSLLCRGIKLTWFHPLTLDSCDPPQPFRNDSLP